MSSGAKMDELAALEVLIRPVIRAAAGGALAPSPMTVAFAP